LKFPALAFAAVALAAAAAPAHALTYGWRPVGDHVVIDASGNVEHDEKAIFASWVVSAGPGWGGKKATAIILNSGGGDAVGGDGLAGVIHQAGMITGVAHNGVCASACVEIWASGVVKTVPTDGRVGVHRADAPSLELANFATTYAAMVYNRLGAPGSVIQATGDTPPSDIHWLTSEEYAAWNVRVIN
jgi:hypothetical protein